MSDKTSRTNRPLRPLLPASASPLAQASTARKLIAKPKHVTLACDACRKNKSKCSGDRPKCRACVKRHGDCHYQVRPQELLDRAANDAELLGYMKTLPEHEAQGILQRLRAGTDAETLVNHIKAGNLLLQMAVAPETRMRYELPYQSRMPEVFIPDNPYLTSILYEATSLYPGNQLPQQATSTLSSAEHQSLYLKPFHAAQVIDPRLSDVKPSVWTTVCSDDALMRDLLGVFFRCEYQFTSAFQKDYFLEDMAAQEKDFCSSLLVNIVLAYSCVCSPRFTDCAMYWDPSTLLCRFLAEAKRIWELEAYKPRITSIQAGILFSVFHNLCGLDQIGQPYRVRAVAMAQELGLFDGTADGQSERIQKGRAFTAWTLYSWETLVAYSFMFPPLLTTPSIWPLPEPPKDTSWYGEVWLRYPQNYSCVPSCFGHIFKTKCQFRLIMNEFCVAAYSKGSEVTLEVADSLHSRLKSWYHDLPPPLQPAAIALPAHLQLHMYYYCLILAIYEPLAQKQHDQQEAVRKIVSNAKKDLYTLIRLYYLRHGFEAMDLFIVIPLMVAGYDCINAINDETTPPELELLRSTLILIAKGLYNQRQSHYLAQALFQVIRSKMRPEEIRLLKDMVHPTEEIDTKKDLAQTVRSSWPVATVKKKEELDSQILTNLVEGIDLDAEERGTHEG
ncbi:hypothetical protein B0I35DRAFT_450360 [Stachybotrys elegans]|uniref:Zn(2)-C6 fungal-type domain-containing protein n=1 Tax=Stachybotrys elegans TaxID=80388 RepID=A0A8K0WTG3_9HYPO|nr:hypothetical protein B0I35DRAFT_450360 [Stachybotrys elegans]